MTKATAFEAIVHVVKTAPSLNRPTRQVLQAGLALRGALLQPFILQEVMLDNASMFWRRCPVATRVDNEQPSMSKFAK